jgi:hypothetical protein
MFPDALLHTTFVTMPTVSVRPSAQIRFCISG